MAEASNRGDSTTNAVNLKRGLAQDFDRRRRLGAALRRTALVEIAVRFSQIILRLSYRPTLNQSA